MACLCESVGWRFNNHRSQALQTSFIDFSLCCKKLLQRDTYSNWLIGWTSATKFETGISPQEPIEVLVVERPDCLQRGGSHVG